MSFNFLNRIESRRRIAGITTATTNLGVSTHLNATVTAPGDGFRYYTWSAPSGGTQTGSLTFSAGSVGASFYPNTKSRQIRGQVTTQGGDAYVECHGGSPGPAGGKATGTFTRTTLVSDNPGSFTIDIGGAGSPNGGSHAGFFRVSTSFANTYVIAGGAGSPAPSTGNPGGAGGGPSGANGTPGPAPSGPGPSFGGGGGSQSGAGGGGSGAPGRCSGNGGGQLQGGNLGGGDPSGRPGGGGGSGYYGGGAGGCGYSGGDNNPGSGGGGGSGYVHPSAQGGTNQQGGSQSGSRVVVRVLA